MYQFVQIGLLRQRCFIVRMLAVVMIVLASGCASTPRADFQSALPDGSLAQPHRVIVYDFASTPAELPADSQIAAHVAAAEGSQSPADLANGRALGSEVARQLVDRLRSAGIETLTVSDAGEHRVGDVLIRGEFISIDPGSRTRRVLIGFGAGRGELSSLVEVFEVTPQGTRAVASAQTQTQGGRLPGILLPLGLAGSAATSLAVSGTSNVAQEMGPESMRAAARRTADGVANFIVDFYRERGWLTK